MEIESVSTGDDATASNAEVQNLALPITSQNCENNELLQNGNCESMQCQPAVQADVTEESCHGSSGMSQGASSKKSEMSCTDVADSSSVPANTCIQSEAVICSSLTSKEMVEQFVVFRDTVSSLQQSNDELRQTVNDGMRKVGELEAAYAKSLTKNQELEQQLAHLNGRSERTVTDVALLSTSLAQMSSRMDKQVGVKAAPSGAEAEAVDVGDAAVQLTLEQRIGDVEQKVQQSATRFTEFASALDSMERDLQRYIRRHSLVVENLCPKEDRSASDAFLVFVNSVLSVTVDDSDVDGLHLLDRAVSDEGSNTPSNSSEKQKDHRPRPILITFTCYRTRTRVYKAWLCHRVSAAGSGKAAVGSLSGERGHGVCIREYLTPTQETVYRKADEARHKRPDLLTDCWTFRGRTFVRTADGDVQEFNDSDEFCPKDAKSGSCVVM